MKVSVSDLSDLYLARLLEDYFGTENLLKSETGVWYFDDLIWRKLSNDELKATATTFLAERVTKVMRSNLSNMLEVFKTYNLISNA